jgi:CheY-like chemotaxis protein
MADSARDSGDRSAGEAPGSPPPKRLLLAEDEPHIRRILLTLLEDIGYSVTACENGLDALAHLSGPAPFDLILLDLLMPGATGIEVLAELRTLPHRRRTPVILLSAKGEDADRDRAFELGAMDFVTKPFSPKRFLLKLERILERE